MTQMCAHLFVVVHRSDIASFRYLTAEYNSSISPVTVDSYLEHTDDIGFGTVGYNTMQILRLGIHKPRSLLELADEMSSANKSYPEILYADAGIPYDVRFALFPRLRDASREQAAFSEAALQPHYALVTSDPKSGSWLDLSEMPSIQLFRPAEFLRHHASHSLLDLSLILERATIVHAAYGDPLTFLADHLSLTAERAVLHLYPRGDPALPVPLHAAAAGLRRDWETMPAPVGAQHLDLRVDHPAAHQLLLTDPSVVAADADADAADLDVILSVRAWTVPPACDLTVAVAPGLDPVLGQPGASLGRLVALPAGTVGACLFAVELPGGHSAAAETDGALVDCHWGVNCRRVCVRARARLCVCGAACVRACVRALSRGLAMSDRDYCE